MSEPTFVPYPRGRRPSSRRSVLRAAPQDREVTVQLDGELLAREELPTGPEALEQMDAAADIVEEARLRSEELLREASEDVTEAGRAGYAAGLERGYAEGLAAARGELAQALALVQAAAREGQGVRDEIVRGAEADIVGLALAALEEVVGVRAEHDRELVAETVRRALERLGAQEVVHVNVHPEDVEHVRAWLSEQGAPAAAWEVRGDGSVAIGGCLIDTTAGQVDARLDVQLAQVAEQLRGAVPHGG